MELAHILCEGCLWGVYLKCISLVSDDLVSEAMEEDDFTDELPCTLAIEDSTEDSTEAYNTDQVSFSHFYSFLCLVFL